MPIFDYYNIIFENVGIHEFNEMIAALKMDIKKDTINQYVLIPKESTGILNKVLEDFICEINAIFKYFKIKLTFLRLIYPNGQ